MDRRIILALVVLAVVVGLYFFLNKSPIAHSSTCGNGVCDAGEKETCSRDCVASTNTTKPLPITCGDGRCEKGEKTSCPRDCTADVVGQSPNDYEDSPFGISTSLWADPDALSDLGIKWTREGVAWGPPHVGDNAVETVKGRFDFSFPDSLAVSLSSYGVYPVVNIGTMNPWDQATCHSGCSASAPSDGSKYQCFYIYCNEEDYKNFVRTTVERYDGDDDYGCTLSAPDCYVAGDRQYPSAEIREAISSDPWTYWEILNEPFSELWWHAYPYPGGDAIGQYIQILEASNEAVHEACPTCKVAIGGLYDYTGAHAPPNGMTLERIRLALDAAGNPFDAMNFHPYGDRTNIETAIDYFTTNYPTKELIITEMSLLQLTQGDVKKLLDRKRPTEKEESEDLIRRYVLSINSSVKIIMWFILQESGSDPVFDPGCLLAVDGTKKLQYYTYKLMVEKLDGSDWDNVQEVYDSGNAHAYKFMKAGQPVWVAWWDYWNEPGVQTKSVTLQVGSLTSVKTTDSVPHFEDGLQLQNSGETYPSFFDTETKSVSSGQVTLNLGQNPVYVEQA